MINGYKIEKSIESIDELIKLAKGYGEIIKQVDDTLNRGSVEISTRMGINKYAYKQQSLFPHTDRSSEIIPPKYVILWYESIADYGGEPIIFMAGEHLSDYKNENNFRAHYTSENDGLDQLLPFYDKTKEFFRFRNDAHLYISASDILKFQEIIIRIENNKVILKLENKDCLIIDNRVVFHGRESFLGERLIHRVHVS